MKNKEKESPYCIAVCAATDPTNGAGIGGDILTIQSLGAYPISVVTAITVQDTVGVTGVYPLSAKLVQAQWQCLVNDISPQAVKWGMLGNSETLETLRASISKLENTIPIVIDPVLASGRGDKLADDATCLAYRMIDLPQKNVIITPNYKEFYQIMKASSEMPVESLLGAFFEAKGAASWLLLKGVHAPTEQIVHRLWNKQGEVLSLECHRLDGEFHGSGCTFGSALAVFLAQGQSVPEAVISTQAYVLKSLEAAYSLGNGQYIPARKFIFREQ
ncbi:MAG: hydroxymethylpyrimidine/phosphomethylpyrimidine kinase [Pseudomonadota bacterium]